MFVLIAGTGSSELFVAATLLVILGTGWLLSQFEISMALGAFLAGMLLSETEFRHQIGSDIRPFRGILLGLFFMTVGMSIDAGLVASRLSDILLIVLSLLVFKSAMTTGLALAFGQPVHSAMRTGLILSQGGEFGFVLFLAAGSLGLMDADTVQLLLTSVALSMVTTPFMAIAGEHLHARMERSDTASLTPSMTATRDLSGHIIIAGFGRVGQTVAELFNIAEVKNIALDLDARRIPRCRAKGHEVFYGDAARADVLKSIGIQHAKGVVVTIDQPGVANKIVSVIREVAPDLQIFARSRDLAHGERLEKLGVVQAVPESLEASLQLGSIVLTSLGSDTSDVQEIIQEVRDADYALIRKEVE